VVCRHFVANCLLAIRVCLLSSFFSNCFLFVPSPKRFFDSFCCGRPPFLLDYWASTPFRAASVFTNLFLLKSDFAGFTFSTFFSFPPWCWCYLHHFTSLLWFPPLFCITSHWRSSSSSERYLAFGQQLITPLFGASRSHCFSTPSPSSYRVILVYPFVSHFNKT